MSDLICHITMSPSLNIQVEMSAVGMPNKVKIDALDLVAGYLSDKLAEGYGVTIEKDGNQLIFSKKNPSYREISEATILEISDDYILCVRGIFIIHLPKSKGVIGKRITIKNISSGVITLKAYEDEDNELIDYVSTPIYILTEQVTRLLSTGTGWITIN